MDIVKHGNYYYLAHSIRDEKKIIYREKYLGKKIPKDIESIKVAFLRRCIAEGAFKKIDNIKKAFQKEWKQLPESIKKLHLIDTSIDLTYNTNAIEGSKITREETEEIIKRRIAPNRPIDDIKESIAHSKVFFDVIQEKRELSLNMLMEWHKMLFSETKPDIAGSLREYSVKVGDYRAPDWQDIKKLMKEYFDWYIINKKIPSIELAARMHYRFEKIHPFGDGNGRIGRLIITYILARAKYPIVIIDYKKRKSYYHALERDEDYFLQYLIRRYIFEFKKYL
jgi:Fic family protein